MKKFVFSYLKKSKVSKFVIQPVSLIVWIWLLVVVGFDVALSYVVAIVLHELGHYFVAKALGYKLNKFSISSYGVSLSYFDQNINYKDEFKIAIAGPLTNFVSSFLVVGMWWLWPASNFFTECFVEVSIALALFNLLPCYPMDGGRIFINLASHLVSEKTAKKITIAINVLLSIVFLVLFVVFCFVNFNPTFFLFAFFLIFGMVDLKHVSKYEKINIFNKTTKNFVRPTILCVSEETTIKEMLDKVSTSKTVMFSVVFENGKIINISEKMLIKLSLNYKLDKKLQDIIKK